jgi:hypothetical protein
MNGIERTLELAEVSEWLDWMRTELAAGGVDLPNEETSVLFALNSVRYADRVRSLCYHLPDTLRSRLIQAGILYQCWKKQRQLCQEGRAAVPLQRWQLQIMPGVRHIRQLDDDGKHLFEAADGFLYVATCVAKPERKYAPATHCLCAELARRLGLPVSRAVALAVDKSLLTKLEDVMGGPRDYSKTRLFMAVRSAASPVEITAQSQAKPACANGNNSAGAKTRKRHAAYRMGSLIFNILTLNLSPKPPMPPAAGAQESALTDQSHCLMDANWNSFLSAGYKEPLLPEWGAVEVRTWASIQPWLRRLDGLDVHPLWEIAFQLPPEWYANDRILITRVLGKLASRCWEVRRTISYLARAGYFPNLKKEFDRMGESEHADGSRQLGAVS